VGGIPGVVWGFRNCSKVTFRLNSQPRRKICFPILSVHPQSVFEIKLNAGGKKGQKGKRVDGKFQGPGLLAIFFFVVLTFSVLFKRRYLSVMPSTLVPCAFMGLDLIAKT
jgi:hypothetical protein